MDVTDVIGDFGTSQKRILLFLLLRTLVLSGSALLVQFVSVDADHWCSPPDHVTRLWGNGSEGEAWKSCCLPRHAGKVSHCQRYEIGEDGVVNNSSTVLCQRWEYREAKGVASIVSEWDLVCDRRWILSLVYSSFGVANLLGFIVSGYFADRFGRRLCILVGFGFSVVTSISTAFSNSVIMFVVARFTAGLAYPFIQHAPFTLFLELSGRNHRSVVEIMWNGVSGTILIIMAALALGVNNWRVFTLCSSIPTIFCFIASWRLPESPRWLLVTKQYARAENTLLKLAHTNGITIHDPENVMKDLRRKVEWVEGEESRSQKFLNKKRLVFFSVLLLFQNLLGTFVFTGFTITLRSLKGNVMLNFMIYGATSILAVPLSMLLRFCIRSRRLTISLCNLTTGLALLAIIFFDTDWHWVRIGLAMSGQLTNRIVTAGTFTLAEEHFPTHLRSRGVAFFMMAGRVGNILTSFTDLLSYKYGANASMILFTVCSFVACLCTIVLPDNPDRNLADSVLEADRNTKKKDLLVPEELGERNDTDVISKL